jgi:hypothetical protein
MKRRLFKPIYNFYAYIRSLKFTEFSFYVLFYMGVESVSHMEGGAYTYTVGE